MVSIGVCSLDDPNHIFIDQQCRRIESSIKTHIEAALPAVAVYFLECQEAHRQGCAMPPPPNLAERAMVDHAILRGASSSLPDKNSGVPDKSLQEPAHQEQSVKDINIGAKTMAAPPQTKDINGDAKIMAARTHSKDITKTSSEGHKHTVARAMWEMRELENGDTSQCRSWFQYAIDRKLEEKSAIYHMFEVCGMGRWLPSSEPRNLITRIAGSAWFQHTTLTAIMVNTGFSLYAADAGVRKVLAVEPEPLPDWWDTVDTAFTIFFTVELLIRLSAYRLWFFISPDQWKSNLFDLFLVLTSAFTAGVGTVDLLFFRCLRVFRVVRMARLVRVVNAFTELRKLLFAVLACMESLLWAVLFLVLTFGLFSLVIMQGVKTEMPKKYDDEELLKTAREQFNGIGSCFITLLKIVGGPDWVEPHEPLCQLGFLYGMVMPIFVCFVQVGIMNIVIGVFAEAASRMVDLDLIARDEIGDLEDFVQAMVSLYQEIAPKDGTEGTDWAAFMKHFQNEEVQAYLAHYQLDVSHVRLIYELFDSDGDGLSIREFVLGLLRFKGEAKGLDMKVMLHAVTALGQEVSALTRDMSQVLRQNEMLARSIDGYRGTAPSVQKICAVKSSSTDIVFLDAPVMEL